MGTVFLQQAMGMVRTILFLFLMSFMPDPGSTLPPTSFASTALTNYIRQITSAHLFSIYNKAKSKRAFTSFRFRNRKNPARIFESEQKRWLQLPPRLVQDPFATLSLFLVINNNTRGAAESARP